MVLQFELCSSAILLSQRLICNGTTRKLSLLKRYEISNTNKRWQNGLLFLPEQVAERGIQKKVKPAYHIKTISTKDKERMLEFLRKFFFRDEPLNLAVKLLNAPNSRCIELEEYAVSSLDQGVSLAAVGDNGELAGVMISALAHRKDCKDNDKVDQCPNPKFRRILQLLAHLDTEARVWEKVPDCCNIMMELRMASTHPEWRGRRIMTALAKESECVAKKRGACAMRIDATSAYSALVGERLGYTKIYSVLYADIPDAPQPESPHCEARVYIKTL